jgi:hypothetical protein
MKENGESMKERGLLTGDGWCRYLATSIQAQVGMRPNRLYSTEAKLWRQNSSAATNLSHSDLDASPRTAAMGRRKLRDVFIMEYAQSSCLCEISEGCKSMKCWLVFTLGLPRLHPRITPVSAAAHRNLKNTRCRRCDGHSSQARLVAYLLSTKLVEHRSID